MPIIQMHDHHLVEFFKHNYGDIKTLDMIFWLAEEGAASHIPWQIERYFVLIFVRRMDIINDEFEE